MRIPPRLIVTLVATIAGTGVAVHGQTYKSHIENPIVRYKMSARLDPAARTVKGRYTLVWRNQTTDTIPDLYFHLYLNAFKNVDSTFMREIAMSWRRELFAQWKTSPEQDKWGWVDVDKIQIVGGADLTSAKTFVHPDDDNAADQSVMRGALVCALDLLAGEPAVGRKFFQLGGARSAMDVILSEPRHVGAKRRISAVA